MAALAAAPVMNGSHDSGNETGTEHSPSRFTAVNGKDTMVSENGPAPVTGERVPIQEKIQIDVRDEQEDQGNEQGKWSRRSSPGNSHNKNKRKRSMSRERESSNSGFHTSRSPVNRSAELPQSNPNGRMPASISEERGNHSATPSHRSDGNDAGQTAANSPWSEYDSQLITQAQRAQQIDASDAHLADALQREAGQERTKGANRSTPGAQQASSPGYAPERHNAVQVAPKRKRVFSNRTKTGCMTCRRRKKKCDEQHPACKLFVSFSFIRRSRRGITCSQCHASSSRSDSDKALQVITVCVVDFYVKDIRPGAPGKSPLLQKHQFLYNPKKAIRISMAHTCKKHIDSKTGNLA